MLFFFVTRFCFVWFFSLSRCYAVWPTMCVIAIFGNDLFCTQKSVSLHVNGVHSTSSLFFVVVIVSPVLLCISTQPHDYCVEISYTSIHLFCLVSNSGTYVCKCEICWQPTSINGQRKLKKYNRKSIAMKRRNSLCVRCSVWRSTHSRVHIYLQQIATIVN